MSLDSLPNVALSLTGSRTGPDVEALALAVELPDRWPTVRPTVAAALYDHYVPYREGFDHYREEFDVEEPSSEQGAIPRIARADEVWSYVYEPAIAIHQSRGIWTVLIGLRVTWDEEHTLGASLQDWTLTDFSGSIGSFEL